ncbi:MAG: hypothetical protein EBY16_02600 [Gammaproteobacteria bacterium]|nr:hypothetical protein [Gammaproteobacteria bacterium]
MRLFVNDLIKKMQHADTWAKEDISWMLSAYNQEIGDHTFFKELIYRAHEAKIIEAVSPCVSIVVTPKIHLGS